MPRTVVASKEVMTSFRCYYNSNANDIKVKTIVFFLSDTVVVVIFQNHR